MRNNLKYTRPLSNLDQRPDFLANTNPISTQDDTRKNTVSEDNSGTQLTQKIKATANENEYNPKINTCNSHIQRNENIVQKQGPPHVARIKKKCSTLLIFKSNEQ